MKNALSTLTGISQALAEIKTIDDAKDLRDKAAAIKRYAKDSRQSLVIQNRASYVKLLCERKAGELLLELPRAQGGPGGRGKHEKARSSVAQALEQAGISKSTAHRWQWLARWPEKKLRKLLESCNKAEKELTSAMAELAAMGHVEKQEQDALEAKVREEVQALYRDLYPGGQDKYASDTFRSHFRAHYQNKLLRRGRIPVYLSKQEIKLVQGCLHPDRAGDNELLRKRLEKAFSVFKGGTVIGGGCVMNARRWDRHSRKHWHELSAEEKRQAVFNMADFGFGDYAIAGATGLSVEAVRQILGERREKADE